MRPSIKAILFGCTLLPCLEGFLGSCIVPGKGHLRWPERIGNITYKIKGIRGLTQIVLHFDRLKPCPAKIRLDQETNSMVQRDSNEDGGEVAHQMEELHTSTLQLLDDDDDLASMGRTSLIEKREQCKEYALAH